MTSRDFDGEAALRDACKRNGINLALLIAETGIWANPEVHRLLEATAGTGAFSPQWRRYRAGAGEKRGGSVGDVRLDDNSYANGAIKKAVGISPQRLKGYEACHIWPLSCYDERYHTMIANLVLLPRGLAGLSDHDAEVRAVLQYRSFELYGWHPSEQAEPKKPAFYPSSWRAPEPFTEGIEKAVLRRGIERLSRDSTEPDVVAEVADQRVETTHGISPRSRLNTQREVMRRVFALCGDDHDRLVREYVAAEERGEVNRKRNSNNVSSQAYAEALLADAVQKGWLPGYSGKSRRARNP